MGELMIDSWDEVSGKWVDWSNRVNRKLARLDQHLVETDERLVECQQAACQLFELRYQDRGEEVPKHLRDQPLERQRVRVKAGTGRTW
jgi:hypothetical protein